MMSRMRELFRQRAQRRTIYNRPEFWDGKASAYEDSAISMFANRNLNSLLERDQFAFIDEVLPDVAGTKVLDVCAGTGRLSRHLARRGATVTSFDFAPAVVEIARRLNGDLPITARVMSVFDLDETASFDSATVLGCLSVACTDAAELADVARRLHRALRPGARLAIVEPLHRGFLHRVLDLSVDEVLAVLTTAGFEVTHRAELHFWPVRFPISHVEWPRFITQPSYAVGEAVLRLAGPTSGWGDYKGIGLLRGDAPA